MLTWVGGWVGGEFVCVFLCVLLCVCFLGCFCSGRVALALVRFYFPARSRVCVCVYLCFVCVGCWVDGVSGTNSNRTYVRVYL